MSQKNRSAAKPTCPGCTEPLESGDRFCGVCGYDLSAVAPRPGEQPTLVMKSPEPTIPPPPEAPPAPPAAPTAPGAPVAGVRWPTATGVDGSGAPVPVHLPDEVPGLDSNGTRIPSHTGDFELPAPAPAPAPPAAAPAAAAPVPAAAPADPRTTVLDPVPAANTKLCVACRAGRVDTDGYCENCGHAQPRERDHIEQELSTVAAVSDRGLRHHRNEDAFAVSTAALPDGSPAVVAVVCDGVSSATRPDEASAAAAATANECLLAALEHGTHPQQAMHEAIVAAAESVNSLAEAVPGTPEHDPHHHRNAPACTIVSAVVANGLLVIGWIGDSRAYWVPDDRTCQSARLTEDDSWAAQMVAAGLMNEAEAYADARAHAITGWLGADAYELDPHTASFKPDRPGCVVVCTDGLWNYAEGEEEMARALPSDASLRPLHAAQVLVGHALDGGGHDNVTVAVLPFALPPRGAGSGCVTL
ncbi:PP2C family protein-serine/threonine phosphatase [Streptomyces paludis]|uniref:Serine/threonine-protein phosphatase n=1 Tax=Streptomyces paludis TaxID=2282738 RepID=A0A345I0K8_9ACTN|nr:PP2C family serine/threonine-protein phosphatase [Streptomyces paludis]AXG82482.1 serine/threonine-protein phosphatase [Streptomyces paludis]